MEQVAQNKADVAAEIVNRENAVSALTTTVTNNASLQASDNTARADAIALINSTNTHYYIVDGEASQPVFTCGSVPMQDNFGVPVIKAGELQQIHYLAVTPDASLTGAHTMTLDIEVWNLAGTKVSTNAVTFTNNVTVHTFATAVTLPASCNIVVQYKSNVNSYHADSRFRLSLQCL